MAVNKIKYQALFQECSVKNVQLVAVSKLKSTEDILDLYQLGQKDFGENYVQELVAKYEVLPKDIRWHFIGHMQSNKVKYIAPFVHLIHGVDSEKLLKEINKQAIKNNRTIQVLLQMHIAQEETKFGMDEAELKAIVEVAHLYPAVKIMGLMGMASFSEDEVKIRNEFKQLKTWFDKYADAPAVDFKYLSMGMSGDFSIAIEEGSNMIRIGSLLFGARN